MKPAASVVWVLTAPILTFSGSGPHHIVNVEDVPLQGMQEHRDVRLNRLGWFKVPTVAPMYKKPVQRAGFLFIQS